MSAPAEGPRLVNRWPGVPPHHLAGDFFALAIDTTNKKVGFRIRPNFELFSASRLIDTSYAFSNRSLRPRPGLPILRQSP
jgi:hypothetical protein